MPLPQLGSGSPVGSPQYVDPRRRSLDDPSRPKSRSPPSTSVSQTSSTHSSPSLCPVPSPPQLKLISSPISGDTDGNSNNCNNSSDMQRSLKSPSVIDLSNSLDEQSVLLKPVESTPSQVSKGNPPRFPPPNPNERTFLKAADRGQVDVVSDLVSRGSNVYACTQNGDTALHLAVFRGHIQVVRLLLSYATSDKQCSNKCYMNQSIEKDVTYSNKNCMPLCQHNMCIMKNIDGDSAIHLAAGNGFNDILDVLLSSSTDDAVNIRNDKGNSAVHLASVCDKVDTVRLLARSGADLFAVNLKGNTPLSLAALKGHVSTIRCLFEFGVDANFRNDDEGDTALHLAVVGGHVEAGRVLLERGADPAIPNIKGNTPLHDASVNGNRRFLKLLLGYISDLSIPNMRGNTPLHYAAAKGQMECAEMLLVKGADPNVKNIDGNTPAHLAIVKGVVGILEMLVKYGADVLASNLDGDSLLHMAAYYDSFECSKFLLSVRPTTTNGLIRTRSVCPRRKNRKGNTPLHDAARHGDLPLCQLLLTYGAVAYVKNNKGRTPIRYAEHQGHAACVALLSSLPEIHCKSFSRTMAARILNDCGSKDMLLGPMLSKFETRNVNVTFSVRPTRSGSN